MEINTEKFVAGSERPADRVRICAIERVLPSQCLTSEELDRRCGGVPGRIEKNTGVRVRYHVGEGESVASLGAAALKKCFVTAGIGPENLDLLLFCGASYDYPVPHTAAIIKSLVADDRHTFHCLDIDSTCLSFLNALEIANLYLSRPGIRRIAIVCSEIASKALRPEDEKVYGLFGDLCVAVILERATEGYQMAFSHFLNFPSGALYAHVPIGGAKNRGQQAPANDPGYAFQMHGKRLIRLTTEKLGVFLQQMEARSGWTLERVDAVITHQTSKYGNEFFRKQHPEVAGKVIETLADYGNCISASLALGLYQWYHFHRKGGPASVLLLGSGAGLSLGGVVLEWEEAPV